jgi:hypothetical protein
VDDIGDVDCGFAISINADDRPKQATSNRDLASADPHPSAISDDIVIRHEHAIAILNDDCGGS